MGVFGTDSKLMIDRSFLCNEMALSCIAVATAGHKFNLGSRQSGGASKGGFQREE